MFLSRKKDHNIIKVPNTFVFLQVGTSNIITRNAFEISMKSYSCKVFFSIVVDIHFCLMLLNGAELIGS